MFITVIVSFTFLIILLFNLSFRFIKHIFNTDEYVFILGLSIIFAIGLLQTFALWFLLFTSKPINSFNSIFIVFLIVLILFTILLKFRKTRKTFEFQAFDIILISIPAMVVGIASASTFLLGDTGWDSNAYHIPLIGMLMKWGSNNWPHSLSEGTFTIYTPYGAHSVQALFVSIFSDFRSASIPTGMLFIGGTLLATSLVRKKLSKVITIAAISLTPSVFGQLTRNYVDIWAGIYLFSGLLVFVKMFSHDKAKQSNINYYMITSFILGLSASSKTQTLISSVLLLLVVTVMRIFRDRSFNVKFQAKLVTIFILAASVPYVRNFIFEQNPIYPIANRIFYNGTISISELSSAVSTFRPQFWPHESIVDPILSVLTPLWVMIVMLLNKTGIYLDANRIDISAFTYDTTTGGPGILSSVFILSAGLFAIFGLCKVRKNRFPITINIEVVLSIFAIIIFLTIPGSWYPRYGMALYFILLILGIRFLENINNAFFMSILLIGGTVPSVFGLIVFQNYDIYSNHRNINFSPKYGLDTPPEKFSSNCENVAILEPRPTFTSFIWEANCDQVISLESETKLLPDDFFIVANHKLSPLITGNREICYLGAWFDPNLTYGTFLYSPINFDGTLCNSHKKN